MTPIAGHRERYDNPIEASCAEESGCTATKRLFAYMDVRAPDAKAAGGSLSEFTSDKRF